MQAPLQPLQDNLESATYETFEKDTTKYSVYQSAIHAAILDCVPQQGAEDLVIMVVGAGRGPLVTAALKASGSLLALHCIAHIASHRPLHRISMPPKLHCCLHCTARAVLALDLYQCLHCMAAWHQTCIIACYALRLLPWHATVTAALLVFTQIVFLGGCTCV